MDKDAYYFPHDSNAKDDPKCLILIEELGLEGYGIFWVLIETLRDQNSFKAPLRVLPALARRYNTSLEKMKAVVARYDLFCVEDDEFFFSASLIERMQPLLQKKQHRKIGGIKGNLIKYGYASKEQLDGMTDEQIVRLNEEKTGFSLSDRLPTVERSHKSKGKESKRKESKGESIATTPELSEVVDYFKEKGFSEGLARKFYTYYQEPMEDNGGRVWKDQNGKTVKSWKQKALGVWMKDEHKNEKYGKSTIEHGQSVSERVDRIFGDTVSG